MARHRFDAPSAPRHDPTVDPFGDPLDVPRGGVAAPPLSFGPAAPYPGPPSPPDGLPAPAGSPGPGSPLLGLPVVDPSVRALGADRAPGSVPAPWTGPTPRAVPSPRTGPEPLTASPPAGTDAVDGSAWSPAVPAPRAGGGRHAWADDPEPVGPAAAAAVVSPAATSAARPAERPRPQRTNDAFAASEAANASFVPRGGSGGCPNGSGPLPRASRGPASRGAGYDPETTPLDLAAIALAGARGATGTHRGGTGGLPALTGRSRAVAIPAAPATGGHRVVGGRSGARGLSPTRTAGALAVAGALVSAGVAVLSSGSMLASAESSAPEATAAVQDADASGR